MHMMGWYYNICIADVFWIDMVEEASLKWLWVLELCYIVVDNKSQCALSEYAGWELQTSSRSFWHISRQD